MWHHMLTQLRVKFIRYTYAGMLSEAEAYAIAIKRMTYEEAVVNGHTVGIHRMTGVC